jgi:uncharacterized protein YggL (DUF469 family)
MLVFDLWFRLDGRLDQATRNAVLERFITEAIEANGLVFGGGGLNEWQGVVSSEFGSVSAEQRNRVIKWLQSLVEDFDASPLWEADD